MRLAEIAELTSRELSKVGNDPLEFHGAKRLLKQDCLNMRWHDHRGVDPQPFLVVAECETVAHDLARIPRNKNWEPFHHAECHEEHRSVRVKSIPLHAIPLISVGLPRA